MLPRMTMAVATQMSHPEPPPTVLTEMILGNGCNMETIPSGTKKEEKKTEEGLGGRERKANPGPRLGPG